jgi:multiple sugar transport system permease protein
MSLARREALWGWLFVAPFLVLFLVFTLSPTVLTVVMSFVDWVARKPVWVGLNNITYVLGDERFWMALRNTLTYVAIYVPAAIILALLVALNLSKLKSHVLRQAFQGAFYLPGVASLVAVAVVWRFIYNREFGLLNWLLSLVGVAPINWLGSQTTALPSLILMDLFTGLGGAIIIFVAAVLGLPAELYDAAHIDGADGWREIIYITLPLLTPSILYVAVVTTIGAMQLFISVFMLTNGGPAGATLTLAFVMYRYAFVFLKIGFGSAVGMGLLLVTVLLAALQFRWFRAVVEY